MTRQSLTGTLFYTYKTNKKTTTRKNTGTHWRTVEKWKLKSTFFFSLTRSHSFSPFIDHPICKWIGQCGINLCKKVTTNGYYSICFFFHILPCVASFKTQLNIFKTNFVHFYHSLIMLHTCDKSTTAMRSKFKHKRVLTVTSIVNVQWQTVIWNMCRSFNPYETQR